MRAVFINQCHPDMPHVCSLRFNKFANAMAALDHKVVLLVETYPRDQLALDPEHLEKEIADHDWSRPYLLPCRPIGSEAARRARDGIGSSWTRSLTIFKSFVADGGMFADWQSGAEIYFETLSRVFTPHVVWATFGNTDSWRIAQKLALLSECPWVADFKDNWSAFVPDGLRFFMARQFRDAAHMTVLSETQLNDANRWFRGHKTVLYSGAEQAIPARSSGFQILLTGSVYNESNLAELVSGLREWLEQSGIEEVEFCYAGNEGEIVDRISAPLEKFCERRFLGFVAVDDFATLLASATVNIYVHRGMGFFHHKVLELIAARRPILSYPAETPETMELASRAGGKLFGCEDRVQIIEAMNEIASGGLPAAVTEFLPQFTWNARAKTLEQVLSSVRSKSA